MANLAKGGTPGTAFVVWDSLDDLSFGDPLKLGFSFMIRQPVRFTVRNQFGILFSPR